MKSANAWRDPASAGVRVTNFESKITWAVHNSFTSDALSKSVLSDYAEKSQKSEYTPLAHFTEKFNVSRNPLGIH